MPVTGWWVEDPALFQRFDRTVAFTLPAQLGSVGAAKHERSVGFTLPLKLASTATERYAFTATLSLPLRLGSTAVGIDGLILVGAVANDGNTVDLSGIDIEAGDRIIMFAYSNSLTIPTAPAGGGTVPTWTSLANGSGDSNASRTASGIAGGPTVTSGTWANANGLIAAVWRNDTGLGGIASTGGQNSTAPIPATYTSPSITQSVTNGTSGLMYLYGGENNASWDSPPAGYTRVVSTNKVCLNIKNDTTSDGAAAQVAALSTGNGNYRSAVVELLA